MTYHINMIKGYVVLISVLFYISIWPEIERFRMYECNDDSLIYTESIMDSVLDCDSDIYKEGYADGMEYAKMQMNKCGFWSRIKVKFGIKAYDFPDYVYERGINYEEGFISGHRNKTQLPSLVIFIICYSIPYLLLGLGYWISLII